MAAIFMPLAQNGFGMQFRLAAESPFGRAGRSGCRRLEPCAFAAETIVQAGCAGLRSIWRIRSGLPPESMGSQRNSSALIRRLIDLALLPVKRIDI
jgi:hypothetical protein